MDVAVTGAKLSRVQCPACRGMVAVDVGDLSGLDWTLDDVIDAALAAMPGCPGDGTHPLICIPAAR